jgi:hypothetical protein
MQTVHSEYCGTVDRVNCSWPSPAQSVLVSGPFGAHDHIFVLSEPFFDCFERRPPLRQEEGGGLPCSVILN